MLQLTIAYVNQAEYERAVEAAIRTRRLLAAGEARHEPARRATGTGPTAARAGVPSANRPAAAPGR